MTPSVTTTLFECANTKVAPPANVIKSTAVSTNGSSYQAHGSPPDQLCSKHRGLNLIHLTAGRKAWPYRFTAIGDARLGSQYLIRLGDRHGAQALFTVAMALGLHQSESLGLRWSDVNVDVGTLNIQRTLQRIDGTFTFFPPKTARSRRTIAMPTPVAAALRQHMKRQLEERMAAEEAWAGDTWGALMFTDEVGRPLTGSTSAFVSASCCNWQGYPQCAIVNCGHGAASLMAAQGVPARVAMGILGHSQISTTMNIYTHVAPELQKEATDKVAEALWPSVSPGLVSELVSNVPGNAENGPN